MADFESSQIIVNDFTGGMSDFFFDGMKEEFQIAENFLFNPDKKISTRSGSRINADNVYQIPSGNHRIGAMFTYEDDNVMFVQSGRNIYVPHPTSWTTLGTNPALAVNEISNFISYTFWNHHTYVVSNSFCKPVKLFKGGSDYVARTAGLPKPSAPNAAGTAGANNYIYAFTFFVEYTVNAEDPIIFDTESTPVEILVENINAPNVNAVTITNIPVLTNGSQDNYDTANIKVRIYRTENNQTTRLFVAEVNNGVTTYVDSAPDTTLINSTELYTTGGVSNNDTPPPAKIVHVLNGTAYYAGIIEAGELIGNRIRQSKQQDPDAVPSFYNSDVQQDITGLSSYSGNLIVFTANKIYRAQGIFDELGNGGTTFDEVSETIGSLNHNGIVQTKQGVFFPGIDGFYWTDGFNIKRVSEKLINTYRTATQTQIQKDRIYATYDKENNRVFWAMMSSTGVVDNDILFVLDLRFGMRDNSTFTTLKGTSSFCPTAICFYQRIFRRGDRRGYFFKHTTDVLTDPKIDVTKPPSQWHVDTIIYDYRSTAMNAGLPNIRKWMSRIVASLRNVSNVSLQIYSHNDDSNDFQPLVEIKDTSQPVWGDSLLTWGQADCIWDFFPLIETFRRFPKNKLRCSYKQLRFTNAYTIVKQSDTLGLATIDNTLKTATLVNVAMTWPANAVDYYLSFEADGYTEQFLVTDQNSTMLTFADPNSTAPNGNSKWLLKGYAKDETLSLLGYILYFTPISKTFRVFGGSLGENK